MTVLGWTGFGLAMWVLAGVPVGMVMGAVIRHRNKQTPVEVPATVPPDLLDRFERWDVQS